MHVDGFEYPDDLYFDLERDLWVRPESDGLLTLGVTAFGVHVGGGFYMCRPKPMGTQLTLGAAFAVVELSKSIIALRTPVAGEVVQINPCLEDRPETIDRSPYQAGWLIQLRAAEPDSALAALLPGRSLAAAAQQRHREAEAS